MNRRLLILPMVLAVAATAFVLLSAPSATTPVMTETPAAAPAGTNLPTFCYTHDGSLTPNDHGRIVGNGVVLNPFGASWFGTRYGDLTINGQLTAERPEAGVTYLASDPPVRSWGICKVDASGEVPPSTTIVVPEPTTTIGPATTVPVEPPAQTTVVPGTTTTGGGGSVPTPAPPVATTNPVCYQTPEGCRPPTTTPPAIGEGVDIGRLPDTADSGSRWT